jgi:hypothetical protein
MYVYMYVYVFVVLVCLFQIYNTTSADSSKSFAYEFVMSANALWNMKPGVEIANKNWIYTYFGV